MGVELFNPNNHWRMHPTLKKNLQTLKEKLGVYILKLSRIYTENVGLYN